MMQTFNLSNGYELPCIAFGTGVILKYSRNPYLFIKGRIKPLLWSITHGYLKRELYGDIWCAKILSQAYESGYRLYDTGRIYGYSEKRIGKLFTTYQEQKKFVITKISDMDIDRKNSPSSVLENLKISINNLNVDYVDGYLLHWPHGNWLDIYRQIIEAYQCGFTKSIGVCNCGIKELEEIRQNDLPSPHILQVEMHPFHVQGELRRYCAEHQIQIMAHTPTARMSEKIKGCGVLRALSQKYHKSIAQIIIRWHYQSHIIPVISSFSAGHMKENMNIWDFTLTDAEMLSINQLDQSDILLKGNGIDDPRYIYNQ